MSSIEIEGDYKSLLQFSSNPKISYPYRKISEEYQTFALQGYSLNMYLQHLFMHNKSDQMVLENLLNFIEEIEKSDYCLLTFDLKQLLKDLYLEQHVTEEFAKLLSSNKKYKELITEIDDELFVENALDNISSIMDKRDEFISQLNEFSEEALTKKDVRGDSLRLLLTRHLHDHLNIIVCEMLNVDEQYIDQIKLQITNMLNKLDESEKLIILGDAIQAGNEELVKEIIDTSIDVNANMPDNFIIRRPFEQKQIQEMNDFHQVKPVHVAAINGEYKILEILLQKGADVNAKDVFLRAPLHMAVAFGHSKTIEVLINNGADVNAYSAISKKPTDIAERIERKDLVENLKKHAKLSKPEIQDSSSMDLPKL